MAIVIKAAISAVGGSVLLLCAATAPTAIMAGAAEQSGEQSGTAVSTLSGKSAAAAVANGGISLHAVKVDFPDEDPAFPGGAAADVVNNNCLACHSSDMILTQPPLSRAQWQAEVDKMRNTYKAPIAAADVPAIVDYLANLNAGTQ